VGSLFNKNSRNRLVFFGQSTTDASLQQTLMSKATSPIMAREMKACFHCNEGKRYNTSSFSGVQGLLKCICLLHKLLCSESLITRLTHTYSPYWPKPPNSVQSNLYTGGDHISLHQDGACKEPGYPILSCCYSEDPPKGFAVFEIVNAENQTKRV